MMKLLLGFLLLIVCFPFFTKAQDSIAQKKSEEDIIITATRLPVASKNIAVPSTIINKQTILNSGAIKLNEVLHEQTGMFITNGSGSRAVGGGVFGNGLQLQGMSPDHTLILIDGEPVNGRQGGVLDISRIAVGNIKRIEIIKGPFSSLYGSEAMGGVVNIITEHPNKNGIELIGRAASFGSYDGQLKLYSTHKKMQTSFFGNYFQSKGYDLNKNDIENTVDPFHNYSLQSKMLITLNEKNKIEWVGRLFNGIQNSQFAINSNQINIDGNANTLDWANQIKYTKTVNQKWTSVLSLIQNQYQYNQQLDSVSNKKIYYKDAFKQNFYRIENIHTVQWNKSVVSILGTGITNQNVQTTRYDVTKQQNAFHLFAQNEISLFQKLKISAGARFDYNTSFKPSFNPKLAIAYTKNDQWKFFMNVGSGFKAPDFRQLYLRFINNAADNYIIYGSEEFSMQELQQQKNDGLISEIFPVAQLITQLAPEKNVGWNIGFQFKNNKNFRVDLLAFRNDIANLIQFVEIAKRANGASIFSYRNINRAFTQGFEANAFYNPIKNVAMQFGYQFLLSGDKTIINEIKQNRVFGRDIQGGGARLMTLADYGGLQFRSKHMANAKITYQFNSFTTSVRCIYRSKWGVADFDGNGFSNMNAEFANHFVQINISAAKDFSKQLSVQCGVNNITNYIDSQNRVNIPGINFFTTIHYKFKSKKI